MRHDRHKGFSLIEMLVAASIFAFMIIAITGIYAQVISLQRRAQGAARVQENALFVVETLSREIRFAKIVNPVVAGCTDMLRIDTALDGVVTYEYRNEALFRNGEQITSSEVVFTTFQFCVAGNEAGDDQQARITMPMTIENVAVHPGNRVTVSLQTTVVSRDLATDLTD